ncbi:MAG: aspartate kinase [Planctomycetes bacterium]|nr:aspartate kinase [Planctomycetota bacterium]
MIVMKFGGSSVGNADRMRIVCALVAKARHRRPCIVLSAMAKTTDALFAAARTARTGDGEAALRLVEPAFELAVATATTALAAPEATLATIAVLREEVCVLLRGTALLRELTPRTCDAIVAHGERISTALLTAMLGEFGVTTVEVDARGVIRTDDRFGNARPDRDAIKALAAEHIAPALGRGEVVVTQGYVGGSAQGFTTTLGRGGSDWSAALLGRALGAEEVQIWTDVEGVLTADPRTVPGARPVPVLSPAEAAELAAFGARVLHPATIQPALEAGIPVTVRHTLIPDGAFTTIDPGRHQAARGVAALASRGPVTVLTMTSTRMLAAAGYLSRLFAVFGELDICVDLVVTAEVSVACTVEPDAPIDRLITALEGLARVEVAADRAIVVAVGEGLRRTPMVIERACRALAPITPELLCMGGNERNLSFVVRQAEVDGAIRRLHDEFFTTVVDPTRDLAAGDRATSEAAS